jgi:hypothetical protein
MDDASVTTVGRLLTKLRSDDPSLFASLALTAEIPADRLERALHDDRCLRSMEQLRLAEWLILNGPTDYRGQAYSLRSQLVASERTPSRDRRSSDMTHRPIAPTA